MKGDTLTIAGVVFALMIVFELVKLVLGKMLNGKEDKAVLELLKYLREHLTDIRSKAEDMHKLVHQRDTEGTPLIYAPRRALTLQEASLREMQETKQILRELLLLEKNNAPQRPTHEAGGD